MAKKLKDAAGSAAKIAGVPKTDIDRHIKEIRTRRQRKDDSTSAHAEAWKRFKDAGGNSEALKLADKLDRMEDDKRNDFLRSFDQLREHMDLDRALDLFDRPADQDNAPAEAAQAQPEPEPAGEWEGNGEPMADDAPGESGEELENPPVAAEAEGDDEFQEDPAPAAEWWKAEIPVDQMPENEGALFNSGREHRQMGGTMDDCPYTARTPEAIVWCQGWMQADDEAAPAADPAPAAEEAQEATETEAEGEDLGEAVAEAEEGFAAKAEAGPDYDFEGAEEAASNVTQFQPRQLEEGEAAKAEEPGAEEKPKRQRRAAASRRSSGDDEVTHVIV